MYYNNLVYFSSLHVIGGIETWLYNLSVYYGDLDVTVVIRQGNKFQIDRIAKKFRVVIWDGHERFTCKRLFVCFNQDIIPFVDAETIYGVLHGDYADMVARGQLHMKNLPKNDRIDKYIGVSQVVCDSWEKLTGIKAEVCYNPVVVNRKKVVRLVSAQRMSTEKGVDRIKTLARSMDEYCRYTNNKWQWDLYGDNSNVFIPGISFKETRLDVSELFTGYDYFVSLSDNEGFCYSAVEALTLGVPCVITDLPVFREIGFDDSNSIRMNLDMSNIQDVVSEIFTENKVFTYEPPESNWRLYFGDDPSTYVFTEERRPMGIKVEALDTYRKMRINDSELNMIVPEGYQFEVSKKRLKVLLGDNTFKVPFVRVVDEPAEAQEKETVKKRKK